MFVKRYIEASKKEAKGIKNIIKRRMFLAYRLKIAEIIEDLKTFNDLKKYFVTKNEADKKLKELQKQQKDNENVRIDSEDIDWYEINDDKEEFYIYSTFVLSETNKIDETYEKNTHNMQKNHYMIGKCCLVELRRRGYDDFVTLAGIYSTNNPKMIGRKIYKTKKIGETIKEIQTNGILCYGEHFKIADDIYMDFQQINDFAEQKLKEEIHLKLQQHNEEQKQQQSA